MGFRLRRKRGEDERGKLWINLADGIEPLTKQVYVGGLHDDTERGVMRPVK